MFDEARVQRVVDKFEVAEVAAAACHCRDKGDWEALGDCFTPDATVHISWHTGTAHGFIERSREMVASKKPGEHSKHMLGSPLVRLNGGRATAEYDVVLHQRRFLEGVELDFATWSRYLDLLEKNGGAWRIHRRTAIYEKDRMDPYEPRKASDTFYASINLEGFPANIRYHCWRNTRSGRRPPRGVVVAGSPEEAAARGYAAKWLSGGPRG
ncbi:MAG: nuclear transport factor 2 family protein [Candidatus Tectomicrobia bacterium]|uniref:Nuclear transport factor 2 family protein n=1 Tax=Tectimicrobiota bacterium TaxID=2528274 RepID=A0A932ZVB9_UNCTE|nr:nuclear transport factor 2 family protein [Candidatus Tectomicrobia bacterium]